jgi:hypothetical protein
VDTRVINPIASVLELSEGPSKLVLKRSDKLLDYESCLSKAEKNKDAKVNFLQLQLFHFCKVKLTVS